MSAAMVYFLAVGGPLIFAAGFVWALCKAAREGKAERLRWEAEALAEAERWNVRCSRVAELAGAEAEAYLAVVSQ